MENNNTIKLTEAQEAFVRNGQMRKFGVTNLRLLERILYPFKD